MDEPKPTELSFRLSPPDDDGAFEVLYDDHRPACPLTGAVLVAPHADEPQASLWMNFVWRRGRWVLCGVGCADGPNGWMGGPDD